MSFSRSDEIETSARTIALESVKRNARQLISDAELLFAHGRYASAAALGVLAVEEVGKYQLLKWNRPKATRYHLSKQRTVGTVSLAEALDREVDVRQLRYHADPLALKNMASEVCEAAEQVLIREALDGTLSKRKEIGFYVDFSEAYEISCRSKRCTKRSGSREYLIREVYNCEHYR